jgi:hypothetical protein
MHMMFEQASPEELVHERLYMYVCQLLRRLDDLHITTRKKKAQTQYELVLLP